MEAWEPPVITILVVDDDAAILTLLSTFLGKNGYRVLEAGNPIKGLELLKTEVVDLVITDLMMPHVDGVTFTEQIHQLDRYRNVPVIMMTAFGNDHVFERGMRKGVALTLAKPLELSKLLDLIGFATSAPRRSSSPR